MKIIYLLLILFIISSSCIFAENKLQVKDNIFYKEGKAFFPYGYVFGQSNEDMIKAKKAKANSVHTEYSFLEFYPNNPTLSEEGLNKVANIYKNSNNNDIIYFPLLTGHYIPGWFGEKMANHEKPVNMKGEPIGLWFQYSIHDKDFVEMCEKFWADSSKNFAQDENVGAYVLWNEPGYGLDYTSYSQNDFIIYLKEKFITLNLLNEALKTNYKDFEEIKAPIDNTNRALWYEWVLFNQESFADFFANEAKIIKSYNPNAMITNKHPVSTMSGNNDYCNSIPMHAKYQDFYGCDLYNGSTTKFRDAFEAARSLSRKAPVVSFEMHQQKGLTEGDPILSISQIVAQIIGGCRGLMYFHSGDEQGWGIWNEETNPLPVREKIFALGEKLNKYPEVFSAKRNDADIAMLYSNHSLIQYGSSPEREGTYEYGSMIAELYSTIRNRHYALDLIANSDLDTYLSQYKVLIIPSYTILNNKEIETVANFHKNGGKIIAFSHSLEFNPYMEKIEIPSFLGLKSRGVAPWNTDQIILVDATEDLLPYLKQDMYVRKPEIVDMMPMEQNIPGYIVKTENKQTALVASCDVFPSIIQSNDGQVIYCAFYGTNYEGMGLLLEGLLDKRLNVQKEISVIDNKGNEATQIMTAICSNNESNVVMILNPTKIGGEFTFKLRDKNTKIKPFNVITEKNININDGIFKLKLNPGEYAFIKY